MANFGAAILYNQCIDIEDVEADHIIPISLGGADILENIQIVHWICNREKGNKAT